MPSAPLIIKDQAPHQKGFLKKIIWSASSNDLVSMFINEKKKKKGRRRKTGPMLDQIDTLFNLVANSFFLFNFIEIVKNSWELAKLFLII